MNKKEVLTFVAALLAASVGAAGPDFTTLIGHRGESEDAPENTLPAYRLAVDRGFGFECDVYLSRDGRVYTFHDPNLTRTSGGANTNKCSDVSWDEVSALDVGSWGRWKGSKFAETRPALLEEVLRLARPGRWIYIDMKTLTGDSVPYIRDILAGQTAANPGNVLFLAGAVACGKELRKHLPEYKVLYCANSRHGWKEDSPPVAVDEVLATMREMDAAGLDIRFDRDVTTADFVKAVKDAGYEFHFWIYGRDRAEDVAEAFRNGADTVTTNCPKRMMDECRAAAASDREAVPLPGEGGTKPALPPSPFSDRMSAYVWRNWGLVERERLADVVGAMAEDLTDVAVQMGLVPEPVVLPEWRTKGYITVVRRNWHLLPYDQMLKLLGKAREEFRFSLMEDDFLWVKLGEIKPLCEPLLWEPGMKESGRAGREAIARVLREEGLDLSAPEEPRFAFVKKIAAVQPDFKMPGRDGVSPFDFRLIFSYFADYGDPLAEPEVESFPEGLLQKLATEGVNAVWLHTVLRTLAVDPKYPEFGKGSEKRIANLNRLVERGAKYGIKVYLYMNEPRGLPASFFEVNDERRAFRGTSFGEQFAMCTSSPEVRRWVRESLRQVFSQVPGLGGIFTITMSENLTNCASRGGREKCPRCRDRSVSEIVAEINSTMIEGMVAGNTNAEALVWNWQWPKNEEESIVNRLPRRNCRLMAVSENDIPIRRGGVDERENDYSISIVGPGENALRLWGFANGRGIPSVAKVQAANSWELGSFPYIPTMDIVAQHAVNLANAGVGGVMLSWSLGCCPSPNLSIYRELRKGERAPDALLDRMASRLYGATNVKRVRLAWKAFSDGFANYPFSCQTIYNGPHQLGPANPLYMRPTGYSATMVGIPYDDLDGWRSKYPRETYAELMGKVADGFADGCRLLEGIADRRELDMFRAEQMHFASCRDQALFIMARDRGDGGEMCRLARAELERAKAYWPIVRADSRIGYESSNHYFFTPRDVLEKILSCRLILDRGCL